LQMAEAWLRAAMLADQGAAAGLTIGVNNPNSVKAL
jgi:hypothetical protein